MPAKTALVLCGGSRGALGVGLYQALLELGIEVDHRWKLGVVGHSAVQPEPAGDRKFRSDYRYFHNTARLIVMEPRAGLDVGQLVFRSVGQLIRLGYEHALTDLKRHGFATQAIQRLG